MRNLDEMTIEKINPNLSKNELFEIKKKLKAAEGDDEDDLEEFPDGNDKDYLLGEIEDLKETVFYLRPPQYPL